MFDAISFSCLIYSELKWVDHGLLLYNVRAAPRVALRANILTAPRVTVCQLAARRATISLTNHRLAEVAPRVTVCQLTARRATQLTNHRLAEVVLHAQLKFSIGASNKVDWRLQSTTPAVFVREHVDMFALSMRAECYLIPLGSALLTELVGGALTQKHVALLTPTGY